MKKTHNVASVAGAVAGAYRSSADSAASDALSARLDNMLKAAKQKAGNQSGLKGFLFEYIEVAKFNADAARKGLGVEARVTGLDKGRGADVVDVEILQRGEVIKRSSTEGVR